MNPIPLSLLLALAAPPGTAAPDPCAAIVAERTALETERKWLARTISDIAMGKRFKAPPSGGAVAADVAGAAASVMLPPGIGLAASVGARAAGVGGKRDEMAIDVGAMIERQREVERRLEVLAGEGCR